MLSGFCRETGRSLDDARDVRRSSAHASLGRRSLLVILLVVGCARGEITLPPAASFSSLAIDATSATYIDLATGASVKASAGWDIGFNGLDVVLNGANGYCLCQNASLSDAQILLLSDNDAALAFESAGVSQVPADASRWSASTFDAHLWYRAGAGVGGHVTPTFDVYLVRRAQTVFKVQVSGYYGPNGAPGLVTLRYAKVN